MLGCYVSGFINIVTLPQRQQGIIARAIGWVILVTQDNQYRS